MMIKVFSKIMVIWILSLGMVFAAEKPLTLIYSGNLDGELEPCGCSVEGDLGGMLRRATALKQLRQQTPDLVAVSSGGLVASMSPQDRLTGEYILKGFRQFQYDAIAVQWNDLAHGEAFVLNDGLPWVASNWQGQAFKPSQQIVRDGYTLAFFAWLDPEQSPQKAMKGEHQRIHSDNKKLKQALKQAQRQGQLTLLSTTLTLDQAKAYLPLQQVDILFIRSAYEVYGEPQKIGNTLVLQPGSRGMRLGRIDLSLDAKGKISHWQHEVISMPSAIADDEALLPWYKEYNARVKAAYLERVALRKAQQSGTSPFVGEEECGTCHGKEHEIWSKSLHSGAFAKLEAVNKAFDPNCIQCHTVGFDKKGGFIDIDATGHLLNVQCESCHGAGRAHADSSGTEPLANAGWQPQQMCAQCHTQPHSPSFKFESYWPRIKHGRVKQSN